MSIQKEKDNHIQWIILLTDDYSASREFYVDTLGFKVEREIPDDEFCQMNIARGFLAIYGRSQFEKLVGAECVGSPGGAIYTFSESNDIDVEYEQLREKGVKFVKKPTTQPWGQRTAYFTDPDGHIWEIQQWVNK